jgi:hypothetical protein
MLVQCALATVGAGFFAISISTFGADPGTGYTTAIAVPSPAAPAARRPPPAHRIDPPVTTPDRPAQSTRIVDQLYERLMRTSGCSLASNHAAMAGGC